MATFGTVGSYFDFWRRLALFGVSWHRLAYFCVFWRIFTSFGMNFHRLASFAVI
jgi:hypothetical protein